MSAAMHLERLGRFPGLRVLAWYAGNLFAGQGYNLLRWQPKQGTWQHVASFDPGPWRCLSSAHRLSARLLRDGYHALVGLPNGTLVAALPKVIATLQPGARRFEATFRIPRGTRPLALAATPSGNVFWGEYFDNPGRDDVHVYGSSDGGRSWQVVYTFPSGNIRHVHSIIYDSHADCLWVLTGDKGDECRILRTPPDWSSLEVVLSGSQQARVVTLVPLPDALYFATDTPLEQNYVYRLRRDGCLERLVPLASSSFWGCRVNRTLFFSTIVEPSPVNNDSHAMLYGSADGENWAVFVRWQRDAWPSRLFQYANIILPSGDNDTVVLAATGLAVRAEDQVAHLWHVITD